MSRAENKEKYKEYDHNYYIKHKRPKSKIGQAELKISDLETKLAESEENNKLLEMQLQDMERSKLSWENQYFTLYNTLKNYREVTEKKHLLDEKEWQDYCAFKHIEPQIKGCLDREREYEKQLAEKERLLRKYAATSCPIHQDKISFAVEQLEKVKDIIYRFDVSYDEINNLTIALNNYTNGFHKAKFKATILIDNQIKQLKEGK